jgi:uncharacterized protein
MVSDESDAAEVMRRRLQADLRAAMKARANPDVSVLRALIAAIDNAGAVPLPPKSEPRPLEVERRRLSAHDVRAILSREYEVRQRAAEEFARLGRTAESQLATREMAVLSRYLERV